MIASGPVLAACVSGLGALLLACLARGMGFAALAGQAVVGVATLAALVPWMLSGVAGPAVGFALAAGLLGLTLPLAGGTAGMRPRLARALPGVMVAATLLAVTEVDAVPGTLALCACGLAASLAAGCARGNEAALAAWRLLRLQGVAVGICLLGLILARRAGLQAAGDVVLCVGIAALGGLAPFGPALARAGSMAPSPLDGLVFGLLPLAAFARLLTVLPALGSALAPVVFVAAGVLAMTLGALAAWRSGESWSRDGSVSLGVGGIVTAGLGLGDAGVAGSVMALTAGAVALSVLPLARRCGGWSGAGARLSCGLPPFGLFGGIILVVDAAPSWWLRGVLAVLACGLLAGLVRRRAGMDHRGEAGTRVGRAVLWVHVAAGLAIGVAR